MIYRTVHTCHQCRPPLPLFRSGFLLGILLSSNKMAVKEIEVAHYITRHRNVIELADAEAARTLFYLIGCWTWRKPTVFSG